MGNQASQSNNGDTPLLNKRIGTLDGLRGLAILLVIGYHYFHFVNFGWIGVDLFFVLSGFLITGKLMESAGKPNYFGNFYLKRILRILPLYYTVLLLFFLLLPVVWPVYISASMHELQQLQVYYWTFTANFYDAFYGWPVNISLIHFWSLCCEMQFYFLWPLLIYFLHRNVWLMKMVLLMLIVSGILFRINAASFFSFSNVYRYVLLLCRLDAFCAGSLLYLLVKERNLQRYRNSLLMAFFLILAIIALLCLTQGIAWHFSISLVRNFGYTLNAAGWACLLSFVLCTQTGPAHLIFNSRLLAWLGKYSYGMYVLHLPVYILITRLQVFNKDAADRTVLLAFSAFIITCTASFASYHLLEKYFLKLKPANPHAKG